MCEINTKAESTIRHWTLLVVANSLTSSRALNAPGAEVAITGVLLDTTNLKADVPRKLAGQFTFAKQIGMYTKVICDPQKQKSSNE